ncbi:hypothetical protein NC651_030849 [Populus alba x Populus x berolinensis]|nr:hypothetical protein NC651_030849 [Populus alba x Populus x berolinensis]
MAVVVGGRVMSSGLTEENGGSNRAVGDSRGSHGGEIKEEMKNELRRGEREIRVNKMDLIRVSVDPTGCLGLVNVITTIFFFVRLFQGSMSPRSSHVLQPWIQVIVEFSFCY